MAALAAPAAPPSEIVSTHWSYQAVKDLAGRGLVHGYKDAAFLGGQKLTRFEMASLVKRVLDNVRELPAPDGKGDLVSEQGSAAAVRGQVGPHERIPTGRAPSQGAERLLAYQEADFTAIKRLASEYSVELGIIGAQMQDALDRIARLEGRVDELQKAVKDPEGPLQKVIADVARIDKVRISGYVQARYENFQHTREADPAGGLQSVTNRFGFGRIRLAATARPTDRVAARIQVDGAGQGGNPSVVTRSTRG